MRANADTPSSHLRLQFLAWLDEAPRSYGETMNAWRTSCPRLSIWEDAVGDGLVRVENGHGPMRDARVMLTETGRVRLQTFQAQQDAGGASAMRRHLRSAHKSLSSS